MVPVDFQINLNLPEGYPLRLTEVMLYLMELDKVIVGYWFTEGLQSLQFDQFVLFTCELVYNP